MEYYSIFSWGAVVVIAAGTVYIYRPDLIQRLLPEAAPAQVRQTANALADIANKKQKKKPKAAKNGSTLGGSNSQAAEESRSSKKRKISAPVNKQVVATTTDGLKKDLPRVEENTVSDRDFAEQLAKAQAGTRLQSTAQQHGSNAARTLQPEQAQDLLSGADASNSAEDAGDDESSSDDLPQQHTASGRDISDMLEPSAAAPTTLRLTGVDVEKKKQKVKAQQFEPVLSKKKRNEQAKREEQKRINQESDRLHERKKQEQLRAARLAAGTSNQTKANNFAATAQNVWKEKSSVVTGRNSQPSSAPLLDTFEPARATQTQTQSQSAVQAQPVANITSEPISSRNVTDIKAQQGEGVTSAFAASAREGASFSEEEQNQRIREVQQEDTWNEVPSKKSKKKSRKDTSSEASPPSTRSQSRAPIKSGPAKASKTSVAATPSSNANRFAPVQNVGSTGLQADEWEA